MNEWVASVSPTLLLIIAAAGVSRIIAMAVNWLWRKFGKSAVDATLLHDVHATMALVRTEVKGVRDRLDLEFANGVPPESDTYVPLRKRVDAAHAKTDEQIETLFEMYGTAHDRYVNLATKVTAIDSWRQRHNVTHEGSVASSEGGS